MSEPVAEVANVEPIAPVEVVSDPEAASLADYRAGKTAPAEPVEAPKVEPKVEAEPDPASEAGKALAAKKSSLQARIDELTREKNQSVAAERAKVAALEAKLAALEKPAAPVATAKPKVDDFATYEDFVEAIGDWKAEQKLAAHVAAQQAERQAVAQSQQQQHYVTRIDKVRATGVEAHPDFDDVLTAFVKDGHVFHPTIEAATLHEELGHEIAYAVAKDPSLNARIGSAPNPWVEIGRLVGKLEAAATPAEKPAAPVSRAPAPIVPVVGETPAGGFDPSKSNSIAEFRKNRNQFVRAS